MQILACRCIAAFVNYTFVKPELPLFRLMQKEHDVSGRRIVLSGVSTPIKGLQWESDHLLRIGRLNQLEVVLADASVTRCHAEVRATPRGWVVRDMGSTTGTLLNGMAVGKTARPIQVQDVLQCGKLILKVAELVEEMPAAPTARGVGPATIKTSGAFVRVQAAAQHSWEQGVQELAHDHKLQEGQHFLTLLRSGYHLCRIASLPELLKSILDDTVAVLNAQRGAIVLIDDATGEFALRAVAGDSSPNGTPCYSSTLVRKCFHKGESMLCLDTDLEAQPGAQNGTEAGMMTSIICALLRSPRKRLGVLHLDRGRSQAPFTENEFRLADGIAASLSVGIENAQLMERQRQESLEDIAALAVRALHLRNPEAREHSERIADYALLLAQELGFSAEQQQQARLGALLQDLGKLAINDDALREQATPATKAAAVSAHTIQGPALAEALPALVPFIPILRSHHERWDGTGHPDGLAGDAIPQLAHLIAVVNAFDSLTTGPLDQTALTVAAACEALQAAAGTQFNPKYVEALLRLRPRLEEMVGSGVS